ncbi:MAG: dihydroorotate dehydrogenase (quinone) [Bacillota bacterium]|nr:MAG: dihydroorotate dehydrogenase (quinone) [Bacillota bacterium]
MVYGLVRPMLFRMDPEQAHERVRGLQEAVEAGRALRQALARRFTVDHPALQVEAFGLRFPNPVGLAAGFDKDARAPRALAALGFGFIEVGTVTPRPQPGNPRPRLFRLPADEALINRMGFNNEGAAAAAARLGRAHPVPVPVGVNIGRNRATPNERAAEDYLECLRVLFPHAAYAVINVSSPNTPELRDLQAAAALGRLLAAVQAENRALSRKHGRAPLPVLVKIAPDLDREGLAAVVDAAATHGAAGIIAVNTTVNRSGLRRPAHEAGGLSGRPLAARALRITAAVHRLTGGRLPVIGVGGIFSARDAYERIRAGATLVQVYTALIYRGPGLARRINRGLVQLLERDGLGRITEAVGLDAGRWLEDGWS